MAPRALVLDPHDGGLAIARALTRRGVPVLCLSDPTGGWVARSRGVVGVELPRLADAEGRWVEEIVRQASEGEGVLLPCSDGASALIAAHRDELPANLRSFESHGGAHMRLMDKASLYEVAEEVGIRYPWRRILHTREDMERAGSEVTYPCVLKPTLSHEWRPLFGEERVFVLESPEALAAKAGPALDKKLALLLSEHVPGPETNLEGHVAVRLEDGSYPLEYTRRKIRQYPLDFGAGSTMMACEAPLTRELSRRLLDAAGFVGLAAVEAKIHPATQEPVLIEVNVRIPQSFGLGEAARVDSSYRFYAALAGLPLGPQPSPRLGAKVVVPGLEYHAARARLRRGDVTWRDLLASYRGVREVGFLDPRDPGPGVGRWLRLMRTRLGSRNHRAS